MYEPDYFDDFYPGYDFMGSEQLQRDIEEYDRAYDAPQFDDYDHYTSDFEPDYDPDYWMDALCPYALEADWINTVGRISAKLVGFMNDGDAKVWKSYDVKNGGRNKREPTRKKFAHWAGYRKCQNKVERSIMALVGSSDRAISTIEYKLKSSDDYKHNATFKQVANNMIETLNSTDDNDHFHWIIHRFLRNYHSDGRRLYIGKRSKPWTR